MQVEVAQLEYFLPRLSHLWNHLSRTGGGIGTRGPGETQLEVDRRRVRDRLSVLRHRLKSAGKRFEVQRNLHPDVFRVSLVGYTNVGKSADPESADAGGRGEPGSSVRTLDATTRILSLGSGYNATLTDTVGFVRKLPIAGRIVSRHAGGSGGRAPPATRRRCVEPLRGGPAQGREGSAAGDWRGGDYGDRRVQQDRPARRRSARRTHRIGSRRKATPSR